MRAVYLKALEPLPEDLRLAGYVTNELLPCPFCGCAQPLTAGEQNTITLIVGYRVFCTNEKCGASIGASVPDGPNARQDARAKAVKKWNTRPERAQGEGGGR